MTTASIAIVACIVALILLAIIIEATAKPAPIPNPRCPPRKWERQRDRRVRADARAAQLANPGHVVTVIEGDDGLAIAWGMAPREETP